MRSFNLVDSLWVVQAHLDFAIPAWSLHFRSRCIRVLVRSAESD